MRIRNILIAASTAILAACATATPYQAAGTNGYAGYSSQKIENNRYQVTFSGNSLTNQETVETYLLHRAAELAVENGYDYFTVADEDTQKKTRIIATPSLHSPYYGYSGFTRPFHSGFFTSYDFYHPRLGWRSTYRSTLKRRLYDGFYGGFGGRFYDPYFHEFNYREVTKFKANAQILLGRGTKPDAENAFDARQVLANLGPTLVYPDADS